MTKLKITISILALTIALTAFSSNVFAIGAAPMRLELTTSPGESVEGTVQAFNSKDEEQVVVLTKGDFLINSNGDLDFYAEADPENSHSMMDWIKLPEENPVLEPNGAVEIKYTVEVPEDAASQSYYGVIFISSQNPEVIETASGVGITTNVAHLVLLEVEGELVTDISLDDFGINQQEENVIFETSVINKGNTHDATSGKILITDKELNVLEELDFNKSKHNSLPESPKIFAEPWKNFNNYEKGIYYAYLDLKDEKGNPLYAELKFKIDDERKVEKLPLKLDLSHEQALQIQNEPDYTPLGFAGIILICAALSLLLKNNKKPKKRKTKKCKK